MSNRVERIALVTVGVVTVVAGLVFAGQGINLIPGSFMTGDRTWVYLGAVIALVGVVLVVLGLLRPGGRRPLE